MASWKSALNALGLTGKGEPVAFEFTLYIRTLAPWPSDRPTRRLALRWTRGNKARSPTRVPRITTALTRQFRAQRHGNTRAVHPLLPAEDEAEGSPHVYEFKEQLHVPATLYKARQPPRPAHARPAGAAGRCARNAFGKNPGAHSHASAPADAAWRAARRRRRAATAESTRAFRPRRCCSRCWRLTRAAAAPTRLAQSRSTWRSLPTPARACTTSARCW